MKILALDISSTCVGVCYDGRVLPTWQLGQRSGIAERCQRAAELLRSQLAVSGDVDLVVIESPVARFAKAIIPQARVSGAVLAVLSAAGVAWVEVAPSVGKKALTNSGAATKGQMLAAVARLGIVADEHGADAYGLYRAGMAMRVERGVA